MKRVVLATLVLALGACAHSKNHEAKHASSAQRASASQPVAGQTSALKADAPGASHDAEATFASIEGVSVNAAAGLDEVGQGVRVEVDVDQAPAGRKGIHVHEKGDCSDIKGKSMGEHFAPNAKEHGLPGDPEHHLGDLGNIDIHDDGTGHLVMMVVNANLKPGDANSFLGKAIVIHEAPDVGTGKSGESGKPIACAVIRKD